MELLFVLLRLNQKRADNRKVESFLMLEVFSAGIVVVVAVLGAVVVLAAVLISWQQ